MEFIETPTFTRLIVELLSDDEYHSLQNALLENPQRGDIIKDGGGIRKGAPRCARAWQKR
jgi:hypothetical protein